MKYELFKGYIRTANKKSTEKFKDRPLHTLDEIKECDEYAGVLNENTVLIDVDDGNEAEIALKIVRDLKLRCRVIRTTKGYHFLFLNNGEISGCPTKVIAVCGITIDVKIGGNDKAAYEVLKYKGKKRTIVYDFTDDADYQTVPKFLLPLDKKYQTSLFNLGEGDGRNDALFTHILPCCEIGLEKDDIREIFRNIVNKYIFKEPLPEKELETILRDDSFPKHLNKFTDKKGKVFYEELSTAMVEKYHVKKSSGVLYAYDESKGYYRLDYQNEESFLESKMITMVYNIRSNDRKETLNYIKYKAPEIELEMSNRYLCVKNGVYDFEEGVLKQHTPDIFLTFQIPHNYNPASLSSELVEKTYNEWMSFPGERKLEEELSGISLIDSTRYQKAVIIYGPKSNGKSSYLNLKKKLFGKENCADIGLDKFSDKYAPAELENKKINVAGEIPGGRIDDIAATNFKKATGGDSYRLEKKYKDGHSTKLSCMHWFSANDMPKFEDETGAIARRIVPLPFYNTFEAGNNVLDIVEQFTESDIEYLLNRYIEGAKRIITNKGQFSYCEESVNLTEALIRRVKSLKDYIRELEEEGFDFSKKQTKEVQEDYRTYCLENDIRDDVKPKKFTMIMKELGYKVVQTTTSQGMLNGIPKHLSFYKKE